MKLRFLSAFKTVLKTPTGKNYVGVQFADEDKNTWTYYGLRQEGKRFKICVSTSIEGREPNPREISEVYGAAVKWFEKHGQDYEV